MSLHNHEQKIIDFYSMATKKLYIEGWSENYFHFGLFDRKWNKDNKKYPFTSFEHLSPLFLAKMKKDKAIKNKNDYITNLAKIKPSDLVIDAACGICGVSIYMAKKFGCKVIGLNISDEQIKLAKTKIQDENLQDTISIIKADCSQNLLFGENSIDKIIIIESLCHFSDKDKFLSESYRILKKGGYLTCDLWLAKNHLSKKRYKKYLHPVCDFWIYKSLESLTVYKKKLRKTGFKIIKAGLYPKKAFLPNVLILENGFNLLQFTKTHIHIDKDQELLMNMLGSFVKAYKSGSLKFGFIAAQKR